MNHGACTIASPMHENTTNGARMPQIPAIFVIVVLSSLNCCMIHILLYFVYISYLTSLIVLQNYFLFCFLKNHKTLFIESTLCFWGNLDRLKRMGLPLLDSIPQIKIKYLECEGSQIRKKGAGKHRNVPDSPTLYEL